MIDLSNLQIVSSIPSQVMELTKTNQLLTTQNIGLLRESGHLKKVCWIVGFGIIVFAILYIHERVVNKNLELALTLKPDSVKDTTSEEKLPAEKNV